MQQEDQEQQLLMSRIEEYLTLLRTAEEEKKAQWQAFHRYCRKHALLWTAHKEMNHTDEHTQEIVFDKHEVKMNVDRMVKAIIQKVMHGHHN